MTTEDTLHAAHERVRAAREAHGTSGEVLARARDASAAGQAAAAVTSFEAAHAQASAELAAAESALTNAARAALAAEIRSDYERFKALDAERENLRARLLGAYLAIPRALSDREWLELDKRDTDVAALNVGLPLVGVSIYDSLPDPRATRRRIDAHTLAWTRRLSDLASGHEASAAQEERAA